MELQNDQAAEIIELMQSPCFTKSYNHSLFDDLHRIVEFQHIPFDFVGNLTDLNGETIDDEKDFIECFIKFNEDFNLFEVSKVSSGEGAGKNNSDKDTSPQKRRWTKALDPSKDKLKDMIIKLGNELQMKSQNVIIDKNGRIRNDSTTVNQILINKQNWR